jgi:hypothetical protein
MAKKTLESPYRVDCVEIKTKINVALRAPLMLLLSCNRLWNKHPNWQEGQTISLTQAFSIVTVLTSRSRLQDREIAE